MSFVFATCQVGFEAALKADVLRTHPQLRLAFSRPGLLTFKGDDGLDAEVARLSPWARVCGSSLTRVDPGADLLASIPADIARVHVFARDASGREGGESVARAQALLAGQRFELGRRASIGERVADVIVSPGEATLIGVHRHGPLRSPWPGGDYPVEVPANAPSRAYAKLEQALAWAELPLRRGQRAVEIGSAPGGAAYALLRRGVAVWGVDSAAMDPAALAYEGPAGARLHHVVSTLAGVRWEALPRSVDWLLCDVHLAPPVALHGLARLVPAFRRSLRGAVLTLKMNDPQMRSGLPTWIERIRALGFSRVEVAHLPANRNELCAVAWR